MKNAKPAWTPNQIIARNLRILRRHAGFTQKRLAELMSSYGLSWTMFTVSDAELAADRPGGRRFTPDEIAALSLIFFVTPMTLMVPPPQDESEGGVMVAVGSLVMPRESYLTDVLLMPSRLATGGADAAPRVLLGGPAGEGGGE